MNDQSNTRRKPVKNIYQRMNAVMKEVDYVQKTEKSASLNRSGLPYSYVSHDSVVKALRTSCTKNGIVIVSSVDDLRQEANTTVVKMEVALVNADNPSDCVRSVFYGYGADSQDKGPGKAYSYAFKYALLKLFFLETGDDDPEAYHVERIKDSKEKRITKEQVQEIEVLINGHEDIRDRILKRFGGDFKTITVSQFKNVMAWIEKSIGGGDGDPA